MSNLCPIQKRISAFSRFDKMPKAVDALTKFVLRVKACSTTIDYGRLLAALDQLDFALHTASLGTETHNGMIWSENVIAHDHDTERRLAIKFIGHAIAHSNENRAITVMAQVQHALVILQQGRAMAAAEINNDKPAEDDNSEEKQ